MKQIGHLLKKTGHFFNKMKVAGTPDEIYTIMEASFRNMFRRMYPNMLKGKSCEWCNTTENLNRCHANKTRPQIAHEAIASVPEIDGMKSWSDIMDRFVALHEHEPVKILCQNCHRKFDKS